MRILEYCGRQKVVSRYEDGTEYVYLGFFIIANTGNDELSYYIYSGTMKLFFTSTLELMRAWDSWIQDGIMRFIEHDPSNEDLYEKVVSIIDTLIMCCNKIGRHGFAEPLYKWSRTCLIFLENVTYFFLYPQSETRYAWVTKSYNRLLTEKVVDYVHS